jgi:hypothetical protein
MHSSFPAKHFNRVPKFFADAIRRGRSCARGREPALQCPSVMDFYLKRTECLCLRADETARFIN